MHPRPSALPCLSLALAALLSACGAGPTEPGGEPAPDSALTGGDVRLEVGEMLRLPAGASGHLRLAAVPGARYALAFLDTRKVVEARPGFEGTAPSPGSYTVTVAEAGSADASRLRTPLLPGTPLLSHGARRSVSAGAAAPTSRATPWREGDRFDVSDPGLAAPVRARVVRVYGGHLVLALAEGEEPEGGEAAWTARADSAFAQVLKEGYPLFRSVLSPTLPVTSAGSGQLLVLAARGTGPSLGSTATVPAPGGGRLSYLLLNTGLPATGAGLLRTLAHELTHAWQEQYAVDTRPAGASGSGGAAAWAVEGSADLLAWMVVGRAQGLDPLGNRAWEAELSDPRLGAFSLLAANTRGDFTRGYDSGASFQLDLAARLVRGGSTLEEALALVARGALEGWHGWDAHGARREGLASRMRRTLDPAWDPAGALLLWTLSQAVDDLTPSPVLQNHAFRAVSTAGRDRTAGWLPPATLHSGGLATRGDPAAPVSVAGNAASITWRYGSPNYFLIEDEGRGGSYTLAAAANGVPLEGVEWMVVRYR